MRETSRAQQAWLDYLAMGGGRSLEKLLALYQSGTRVAPTVRLRSLKSWSAAFGWQARLADVAGEERQAIVAQGIAARQNRVDAYGDRWARMRQVIAERGADSEMAEVPGGKTGLLVRTFRTIGGRSDPQTVEEFAVDTGLLKELREIEKQAAEDMGQWTEKLEHSGPNGKEIVFRVTYGDPAETREDRDTSPPTSPSPEAS
ncbi:MAG: hypothetical protein V2A73_07915 [Pseudomonadota bacterium]